MYNSCNKDGLLLWSMSFNFMLQKYFEIVCLN